MPNVPDYSQYIGVKKTGIAQTVNTNTALVKSRAPSRFGGYFPLYKGIKLPINALVSNKFTSGITTAPPTPFAPSDIANFSLWLDASALTNGATISTWNDKTTPAENFPAVGGPTPVVSQIGGLNYIDMTGGGTGTNGYYRNTSFSFPAQYSFFFVGYTTRGNSPSGHIAGLANAGDLVLYIRRTGNGFDALKGNGVAWTSILYPGEGATTTPRIMELIQDNTGSGLGTIYTNGVSRATATGLTIGNTGLEIGARGDANTWGGYIGEVLLYSSPLAALDRQKVEGYLAWKWNLVSDLAADHPYKSAAP